MGKTPANVLLLRLSYNDSAKESTMIHNFTYAKNNYDIHETNLIIIENKTLILMTVICCR